MTESSPRRTGGIWRALRFLLHSKADTTPLGRAFAQETATRILPWVIALMVYIALLMVSGAIVIDNTIARWQSDLAARLTVVVSPRDAENRDEQQSEVQSVRLLSLLRGYDFVQRADLVSESVLRRLLEPWLGSVAHTEGLPLPQMIDVVLARADTESIALLRRALERDFPEAVLEDHRLWRTQLWRVGRILQLTGLLASAVSLAAALLITGFAAHASMSRHAETIQLLRFLGAEQSYITAQFMPSVRRAALYGSTVGYSIFFATYAALRTLGAGLMAEGTAPHRWQWAAILAIPILLSIAVLGVLVLTTRQRFRKGY